MSKLSDKLRRESQSMGESYPGDVAAARQHLKLARQCKARAYELDPSLRADAPAIATDSAPRMALDAATEEAIIQRALKTAHQSNATRRSTSTKVRPMLRSSHALDINALFQTGRPDRSGENFAAAWDSRHTPRRASKAYALDAEPDHEKALRELEGARDHIEAVKTGYREYDPKHFGRFLANAVRAMGAEAPEGDEEGRTAEEDLSAEERHVRATGKPTVGKDGRRARAHDSAMAGDLDVDSLFQIQR